jgi:hypothetical protein
MSPIKEYDAKIDLKRRVTIRGARYDHYHVTEFDDGRIELAPRELVEPFELSARTLAVMDASIVNLEKGKTGDVIDLSAFSEDR